MKTYYRCQVRFRQRDRWAIWYSNEQDGLVVRDGKIPFFGVEDQAEQFADEQEISLEDEEPILHDFDLAARWVQTGNGHDVDCSTFIAVFNLCTDLVRSLGQPASWESPGFDPIYEKLFFGCNLRVLTPPGEQYVPAWSREEVAVMRDALRNALDQFLAGAELVPDL